ncbi:LOW QUALITY PROTEIN: interleukin-17 receptor B [Cygnus olor]|uniref:LOW QUALITY PROTEIN: interleukin-17 receptor B n=1 Tax=Cygnus olor TaxID=8869 RepID=UPI001ADE8FC8|nr:LOW QUALITY PROTEIN: interleukin-17 receptor B [Cygnus olor]
MKIGSAKLSKQLKEARIENSEGAAGSSTDPSATPSAPPPLPPSQAFAVTPRGDLDVPFDPEGPVPELRKQYHVAPADLHNLNAVLVEKQVETQFQSYFMNISWSLSTDGSFFVQVAGGDPKETNVKELTATKISVNSKGIIEHFHCIRCYYTEKFQSQTAAGNQGWQFYYVGFPVEPETKYFIQAYNLPPANINDDFPSKSLLLTTPDTFRRQFFHQVWLQLRVKVLVIYPDVCLYHTVLSFAQFLHEGCQTDVILDLWERRRIAEKGPVAWLAAQKAAADRVIFLSSNPTTAACDSACKSVRNYSNTESMFSLAVNLFCSDMTNRSSVQKYVVVSFNEANAQDTLPSALNICPKYCLMKDMKNFYRDLFASYN